MFRYRAIKKNPGTNDIWYYFSFEDCPVLSTSQTFFLANKFKTPTMKLNTISRGHPTLDLFEGDIVVDKDTNKELGVITYDNGFKMVNFESKKEKIPDLGHIYIRRGTQNTIHFVNKRGNTPIRFFGGNIYFSISDMVAVRSGVLYLIIMKKPKSVLCNRVSELLYIDEESSTKIYDGYFFNGTFYTVDNIQEVSIA